MSDEEDRLFPHIEHEKKRAFLVAFSQTGNVTKSTEIVGIDRTTPYSDPWKEDDEFQQAWTEARRMAGDILEDEAIRRAVEGVEEPVGWYKGEPGGTVRKYSDTLLIFLMKGARPDKYVDRQVVTVDAREVAEQIDRTLGEIEERTAG